MAFELSLLLVQSFLLKLCRPFFISGLGRQSPTFSIFLFKSESFIFFLLLSMAILAIELLLPESKLLCISLGLESIRLFKFTFVQLSQVSLHFGLLVLGFPFQTQLFFFESLFTGSFFSFVFGSVGFVHGGKFFLTFDFILLCFFLSIGFLLGQTFPGSFELSHALQFFLLLQFSESFFLNVCLIASYFFCSFCLLTQAFSLSKFSATLSLGPLLLLSLFLNLDSKLLLFLLLLFDNGKIVVMVFVFFSNGRFLTICLFVVFSIDGSIVLVFTTTTFALSLAILKFVIIIDGSSKEVTLLTAELPHEVLLGLISLNSCVELRVNFLGLSIDVILKASNHVVLRELVFTVILSDLAWSQGPRDAASGVVFFIPTSTQLDH